jgi:hypothetical protein
MPSSAYLVSCQEGFLRHSSISRGQHCQTLFVEGVLKQSVNAYTSRRNFALYSGRNNLGDL